MTNADTADTVELLPCPFCGGPASDKTNGHSGWIGCMPCGIGDTYAPEFGGRNERTAWNRRDAPASARTPEGIVKHLCGIARSVTDVVDSWSISKRESITLADVDMAVVPLRLYAQGLAILPVASKADVDSHKDEIIRQQAEAIEALKARVPSGAAEALEGRMVVSGVHPHAEEPRPDFDAMKRTIETPLTPPAAGVSHGEAVEALRMAESMADNWQHGDMAPSPALQQQLRIVRKYITGAERMCPKCGKRPESYCRAALIPCTAKITVEKWPDLTAQPEEPK